MIKSSSIISILIAFFCLCSLQEVKAQNLNFSQFNQSFLMTNPALVARDNYLEANLNYRLQRSLIGEDISTALFSFAYPLFSKKSQRRWGGLGFHILSDRSADFLVTQGIGLTAAYNMNIGRVGPYFTQLSFGMQGSYNGRRVNLTDVLTSNQVNDLAVELSRGTGENFNSFNQDYFNISSGIYWYANDEFHLPQFYVGAAAYNLNQPLLNDTGTEVLPWRFTGMGGYRHYTADSTFSVLPNFKFDVFNSTFLYNVGSWFTYHFDEGKIFTDGEMQIGAWYYRNRVIVTSFEFYQHSYILSLSFDLRLSKEIEPWQDNTPEISVSYRRSLVPPDRDGDGTPDKQDDCPNIPGLPHFQGCPDSDNDGIQDARDQCPKIPGLEKFKGCPDSDGDGVKDALDRCPQVAGPIETGGCPDTDGDGVVDILDPCPEIAGPYNGCPDSDNDQVPDNYDMCPDEPGVPNNFGCPELINPEDTSSVVMVASEIEIMSFELNFYGGQLELEKNHTDLLNFVLADVQANPHHKIKLSIYTNNPKAGFSSPTELRLKSIFRYFEGNGYSSKNIAYERLNVSGTGFDDAIDTIEIRIIEY